MMHISTPRPVHRDVALRYHLKNRFNPIYASERVVQLQARRMFFRIGIVSTLSISLAVGALIWFLSYESFETATRVIVAALPCLLLGLPCMRLISMVCKDSAEEKTLRRDMDIFEERYDAFLKATGLTLGNIDPLSDKKLERLCEDLLGTEAKATATRSPKAKKVRQKRFIDIYQAVTHIGYGNRSLEDYVKRAGRKPRTKKAASRRATA